MINRRAWGSVILLSALFIAGCSGVFGESSSEQADRAILDANRAISEHNRFFDDARGTYTEVRQEIEAGNAPDQRGRITEARNTMERARTRLQDARASLQVVDDLDVEPNVRRYANLLSGAMEAQISAEASEIRFYELLEQDPALEDNRQEALDLLESVGDDYREAEADYEEARRLADSSPRLIEAR